jgi:hypothetical protein
MSARRHPWRLHMSSSGEIRPLAVLLLLSVSAVLAACGGDGGRSESTASSTGASTAATTTASTGAGTTGTTTATTGTTDTSGTTGTSTGGTTVDGNTIGNLIASPDNVRCAYVPNGSLSGADQLTVFFFILLIGASPQQLPGLVAVDATSSTGLSTHLRSAVSNRGATPVQLDLESDDFGHSHTITIVVDPSNEVPEDDETDNRIKVNVFLPSPRPDETIADLHCSVHAV